MLSIGGLQEAVVFSAWWLYAQTDKVNEPRGVASKMAGRSLI